MDSLSWSPRGHASTFSKMKYAMTACEPWISVVAQQAPWGQLDAKIEAGASVLMFSQALGACEKAAIGSQGRFGGERKREMRVSKSIEFAGIRLQNLCKKSNIIFDFLHSFWSHLRDRNEAHVDVDGEKYWTDLSV